MTDLVFRGHTVTAVSTHPFPVPAEWVDRVVLRAGDLLEADLVDSLVAGTEAVVDAMGDCRGGRALAHSATVAGQIAASMQHHGRFRYIGLRPDVLLAPPGTPLTWHTALHLLKLRCPRETRQTVADAFAALIRSPLSWTVVRCPGMTDGPPRGVRHVGMTYRDGVGSSLTRTDAARFLSAQVLDSHYICAAPAISN